MGGIAYYYLVAQAAQVIGGRKSCRAGADYKDCLAGLLCWWIDLPTLFEGVIAQEALD